MARCIAAIAIAAQAVSAALNTASLATQYFGNDAAWYKNRIPFFEISDAQIQSVYYYRWKIFRAHQRDLGSRGYVSTEFLDDVGWQLEPWATLNDATGFHIGEGRWLRDRRFAEDYIRHMYEGGANDRHFTDYMADSVYGRYLVDGDQSFLTAQLNYMTNLYGQWADSYNTTRGLYWREPLTDATEYTISSIDASGGQDGFTGGFAYRPSINSYMWANAIAIANVADLAGQANIATTYRQKAATLKSTFQAQIWNTTLQHFIDRQQRSTSYVTEWQPIRGRELVGLVPWMFGMPDNVDKYNQAWKHLIDTSKLRGSNGMRTNEPSYQYYMRQYRYEGSNRECQWNGPVWPYQTTQVLLGMANLLNSYTQSIITKTDYLYEIRSYTRLHYNGNLLNLQEDYEPDKTGAIVGLARSPHYFHSGYNDLIISGLVGIRPRADNTLEVNPLVPAGSDISYFRLQDISYHGHSIAVEWDSTGSRYSRGAGLKVEVDGVVVASAATIQRLTATISKGTPPAIIRTNITKSTQLYRDQYPKGSASSGTDAENIHDAIDGRVWFFPELPNGWNSDAQSADSTQWYTIDFGTSTSLSGCTLAFYDDGATFIAPPTYDILQLVNGAWVKINGYGETLLANGITNVQWSAVSTNQLRVSFPQKAGKRVRLVEFKAF